VRLGNEIACWDDIEPLGDVLMAVEHVLPERFQLLIEHGHAAFKPRIPPMAGFELTVMADMIGKLVEDEIAEADADNVVRGVAALRTAAVPCGAEHIIGDISGSRGFRERRGALGPVKRCLTPELPQPADPVLGVTSGPAITAECAASR
jgi:hypothetical protein